MKVKRAMPLAALALTTLVACANSKSGSDTAATAVGPTAVAVQTTVPSSGNDVPSQTRQPEVPATRTSTTASSSMPNLQGKRLSDVESALAAIGITSIETNDATGQDRIVLNSINWVVQNQQPGAGTTVTSDSVVTLEVAKPSDGAGQTTDIQAGIVPGVVCKDLQSAQDTMQSAGFVNLGSADGLGQGRMQILDRNWVVIGQTPQAGTRPEPGVRIVLTAVKFGEPTGASGCRS